MQIYKTTNLINGKIYIGKDQSSNQKYMGSGKIIVNAIKKYGIENFKKEILEKCDDKNVLREREKFWIKELNSRYPHGYNISQGGEDSDTLSHHPRKNQIIEQMKKTKAQRMNDETRKKMSQAKKGKAYDEIFGQKAEIMKIKRKEETTKNWNMGVYVNNFSIFSGEKNPMYGVHRYGKDAPMFAKKQPTEICIYCKKKCSKTNIKRWHNENCKQKI
ncbi:MAG: hypothetical protein JETCAE03_33370 [Ignavibacteriaceae bacterium]|nr:MAG: hypothetical protein JETCAE03_33370 [Ignavibacteriaceae bacterium]